MTDAEYERKMHEVDQLLNDPQTPISPDRIWSLLEDLARANPERRRLVRPTGSWGADAGLT